MRAGQRVGKYVLDERIAVGGMAEVWAGRVEGPQGFTKPLALKFILESFAGDPELERLFVNEARIAAQLQHANLVTVFDFDKVGPGPLRRIRDFPADGERLVADRPEGMNHVVVNGTVIREDEQIVPDALAQRPGRLLRS